MELLQRRKWCACRVLFRGVEYSLDDNVPSVELFSQVVQQVVALAYRCLRRVGYGGYDYIVMACWRLVHKRLHIHLVGGQFVAESLPCAFEVDVVNRRKRRLLCRDVGGGGWLLMLCWCLLLLCLDLLESGEDRRRRSRRVLQTRLSCLLRWCLCGWGRRLLGRGL